MLCDGPGKVAGLGKKTKEMIDEFCLCGDTCTKLTELRAELARLKGLVGEGMGAGARP